MPEAQVLANALIGAAPLALVALGFGMVLATRRYFHLAHAGVVSAAPYLTLAALRSLGLPLAVAAGLGVLGAGLLGLAIERLVDRPLSRRGARATAQLLASTGLLAVLQALISLGFGDDLQSLRSGETREAFAILGARITRVQVIELAVCALAGCATWFVLLRTRTGMALRALGSDSELAHWRGLPIDHLASVTLGGASLLGGLAGVLMAYDTGFTPRLGFSALFAALAIVVVAGHGRVERIVPAAILVSLVREGVGWWLPIRWQDTAVFALLLAALALRRGRRDEHHRGVLRGA